MSLRSRDDTISVRLRQLNYILVMGWLNLNFQVYWEVWAKQCKNKTLFHSTWNA